jgi:hypothetical protein
MRRGRDVARIRACCEPRQRNDLPECSEPAHLFRSSSAAVTGSSALHMCKSFLPCRSITITSSSPREPSRHWLEGIWPVMATCSQQGRLPRSRTYSPLFGAFSGGPANSLAFTQNPLDNPVHSARADWPALASSLSSSSNAATLPHFLAFELAFFPAISRSYSRLPFLRVVGTRPWTSVANAPPRSTSQTLAACRPRPP